MKPSHTTTLVAVENVALGGLDVAVVHQDALYQVLHMLDIGSIVALFFENVHNFICQLCDAQIRQ